jgi:hypothetical protein
VFQSDTFRVRKGCIKVILSKGEGEGFHLSPTCFKSLNIQFGIQGK